MGTGSWLDFTAFNLILTLGVAAFPLGWIGYETTGGPAQVLFLAFLATKLTILPLFGVFAYWNLLNRFHGFGKLSLLVPVLTATPPGETPPSEAGEDGGGQRWRAADPTGLAPPSDDDMAGIGRVK